MSYLSSIDLDTIDPSDPDKADTLNDLLASLSAAALYGIKSVVGLSLTLCGGKILVADVPTSVATQTVALTANATNYVYAILTGSPLTFEIVVTTSLPTGWPGPITSPSGALALYELTCGPYTILSGENYVPSMGPQGATGATGERGVLGSMLGHTRRRLLSSYGDGSLTTESQKGWGSYTFVFGPGLPSARTLGTSSFRATIPYEFIESLASAGSSASLLISDNPLYFGDSAGRGGFDVQFRWCFESSFAPANGRCFIGLIGGSTAIGNVEPDTKTNIIGVGSKAGEANLSIIHNDGSGTATMSVIVSDDSPSVNFPAKSTDNVYDLRLTSQPNSQTVQWILRNVETGNQASGTISTDLPSNATFLTPHLWANNGSTASAHGFGLMRIIGESRY